VGDREMTSLLVVYYSDPPDANWDHIISLASPGMTVILDPTSNGAGSAIGQNFLSVAQRLKAAGAKTLGYVWTNYGNRVGAGARADVSNYVNWYGVDGVFLDGALNVPQYAPLISFARSLGLKVIGNPGTSMVNALGFDALVTWEQTGYPGDVTQSYIAENVLLDAFKLSISTGAYVYATDADYLHLPSYFDQLVAAVSGSQPPPPGPTILKPGIYQVL
jgi:hypothetical protein